MVLFDRLQFWRDAVPRSGPENMAVDDWLLEQVGVPTLRVYEWDGDWVSIGYFGKVEDLAGMTGSSGGEDGTQAVRRATGGGIVDHRIDRTYTVVVPAGDPLAQARGLESYRVLHEALAAAMRLAGVEGHLVAQDAEIDSAACFEKPVTWDVVDATGRKLAGAGQRRTRSGLLHQGSVVLPEGISGVFEAYADGMAGEVELVCPELPAEELGPRTERFARSGWLARR